MHSVASRVDLDIEMLQEHGAEHVQQALDLAPKTKDLDAKPKPTDEEILDVAEKRVGKTFASVLKAKRWAKGKKARLVRLQVALWNHLFTGGRLCVRLGGFPGGSVGGFT